MVAVHMVPLYYKYYFICTVRVYCSSSTFTVPLVLVHQLNLRHWRL